MRLASLDDYVFIYFVCEGTNEEAVLKWLDENDALIIDKDNYSLEYCRSSRTVKGRKELANVITGQDYGGKVGTVYICDSHNENWHFRKGCTGRQIDVVKVVTSPEIEILVILALNEMNQWRQQKKENPRLHPSDFCKSVLHANIKNGDNFISVFGSVDNFKKVCKQYRRLHREEYEDNELSLFDLLK
ncbi:MAG: hypothetical protein ACFWT7_00155 [Succiniclasticum sp.]|jgi:hypothetical protein